MLGRLFLSASPHYGVFIHCPAYIAGFSFQSSLVVGTNGPTRLFDRSLMSKSIFDVLSSIY